MTGNQIRQNDLIGYNQITKRLVIGNHQIHQNYKKMIDQANFYHLEAIPRVTVYVLKGDWTLIEATKNDWLREFQSFLIIVITKGVVICRVFFTK